MTLLLRLTLTMYLAFGCGVFAGAIDWPVVPQDQSHPLGNSYGEFQDYGGYSYFHPGIDIMAPAGTPVYAVKAGYVKAVLTISAELHWRVAIGDSAGAAECDGWLYAHLDEGTIAVMEGEWVDKGQYLGDLVYWPVADFHHLHFVKIRNSGTVWSSNWQFLANPLDELAVIDDDQPPQFSEAFGSNLFAFCQNESTSYFAEGENLSGDVDIICRVDDMINHTWLLAPYRIEYRIEGDSSIPWTNSVCFHGPLDWSNNIDVVYQDDAYCDSRGDYDYRWFYFNLTNTDGDSLIEGSDRIHAWRTANFHNGTYTVSARAYDRAGNVDSASMDISVANYYTLDGSIACSDGDPYGEGTVISILPAGQTDTTDSDATFSIHMVGGGSQTVRAERAGYAAFDTTLMMNQHHQLDLYLTANYLQGDANFDNNINLGDVVYVINYVFKGGPGPRPYFAGDANSDGIVDIGDAVFLIDYIFHDGLHPAETLSPSLSLTP